MRRCARYAVAFLIARAAMSQVFQGLAVTTGGDLYFSIAPEYRATVTLGQPKPASAGFVVISAPGRGINWYSPTWGPVVGTVDVSGDGNTIAVTLPLTTMVWTGLKTYQWVTTYTSRVVAPGLQLPSLDGRAQLSRHGRYVLIAGTASSSVLDLLNGVSRIINEGGGVAWRQAITNDGSVLLRQDDNFVLSRGGNSRKLIPAERPSAAGVVSSDGSRVAYVSTNHLVHSIDVQTGEDVVLARGYSPWISDDGRLILFHQDDGALAVISFSGPVQQIAPASENTGESILSGDGASVYTITQSNRVLRFGVADGSRSEIVPRTPAFWDPIGAPVEPVPGSLNQIQGTGFSDGPIAADGDALPTTLSNVRIQIGSYFAPLLSATPGELSFQLPFELQPGLTDFTVISNSPFLQRTKIDVKEFYLQFLSPGYVSGYTGQIAIHQDFRSIVTLENPAKPGETLHFYVVGLGPVSPGVATGMPGPVAQPAAVQATLECSVTGFTLEDVPLKIYYAGLAPLLHGIYQLSVQLPAEFPGPPEYRYAAIRCGDKIQKSSVLAPIARGSDE